MHKKKATEKYISTFPDILCLKESELTIGGFEVWSLEDIPVGIRFGPYKGILTDIKNYKKNKGFEWQEERKGKEIVMLGKWDERGSNWLQYVNFTCSKEEQNLLAIESLSGLYFITSKPICANTELLVWYEESLFKYMKGCENAEGRKETLMLNCTYNCENMEECTFTRNECKLSARSEINSKKFQGCTSRSHILDLDIEKIIYVVKTNSGRIIDTYDPSISRNKFIATTALEEHESIHIGKNLCKYCKCRKKCNAQSTIVTHKLTRSNENFLKYNICDEKFNTNNKLLMHGRIQADKKHFECNNCDKKFCSISKLMMHVRMHSGEKPFKCNVCEKEFSIRSNMLVHKKLHTGERPFECNVCEKKFKTKNSLVLHKRIHTGEKPHGCIICGKTFSTRSALIPHKRIHTGEKPFECNICEKKFTTKRNWRRHGTIHTGDKLYEWLQRIN